MISNTPSLVGGSKTEQARGAFGVGGPGLECSCCDGVALDPADEAAHGDSSGVRLSALVDHIITVHHDRLRRTLPRMLRLVEQVARAHGDDHPRLVEVYLVFDDMKTELEFHILKEEKILFPMIKQLDPERTLPCLLTERVGRPLLALELEHTDFLAALARIRVLTCNFRPPACAGTSYRAMLDGLARLESELQQHIHEEDDILFPRARAAERELLKRNQ